MRRYEAASARRRELQVFEDSTVLITGGTGSLGHALVPKLLNDYTIKKLIILSRDEMKQWEMQKKYQNEPRLRFFIGDVRDKARLHRAFADVDFIIHAAATKIVPIAEYNPFECIKTNVNGAMNVIDAALDCGVKKVVALSTDKASSPINLYGASKLASDKLFIAANAYSGKSGTKFSVVRYGNVMGSRGSVIPLFLKQAQIHNCMTITDPAMTRFMISLDDGVELVLKAFNDSLGGEIYVKKIPSMNIRQIARAVSEDANIKIIGIRPGEKLHEQMIGPEDAPYTYQYPGYYKIIPSIYDWAEGINFAADGKKVPDDFVYSSDSNDEWMTVDELKQYIHNSKRQYLDLL